MTLDEIAAGLARLSEADFDMDPDDAAGWERLDELADAVLALPEPNRAVPELFAFMERLQACDLGSPGSLVHPLEKLEYEDALFESVGQKPTRLGVWMINRIPNSPVPPARRAALLELLSSFLANPLADEPARERARDSLEYQANRDA